MCIFFRSSSRIARPISTKFRTQALRTELQLTTRVSVHHGLAQVLRCEDDRPHSEPQYKDLLKIISKTLVVIMVHDGKTRIFNKKSLKIKQKNCWNYPKVIIRESVGEAVNEMCGQRYYQDTRKCLKQQEGRAVQ